jgi:ribosomal protein S18 acetylase RimI-like enzyme
MTPDLTIRLLATDDVAIYRELRLQALNENPEAYISTFEVENKKPLSSFIYEISVSKQMPLWGYYGLFLDQDLIGFCQISRSPAPKKLHVAYLYNLYLVPKHRGKGWAKKLVTELLEKIESQDVERVFITYLAKNESARKFYNHLGFKECGVKPKAIKDGDEYDDEVEMVFKIK